MGLGAGDDDAVVIRGATITAAVCLAAAGTASAQTARPTEITTPPGSLEETVERLARLGDLDVAIAPGLATRRVPALRAPSVAAALRRAAAAAGGAAIDLHDGVWRIEPGSRPAQGLRPNRSRPLEVAAPPATLPEVVVTGAKRPLRVADHAGSLGLLAGPSLEARPGDWGSGVVVRHTTTVDTTHLGPGRNKLSIRGVSDSAFLGPLQSTVGQYLGDIRLTYAAPDPDLALVDLEGVEVLEGPQGVLYGSGSLGGVVRALPRSATALQAFGRMEGGLGATRRGGPSADLTVTANHPLADDAAVRLVAYGRRDGGYIDNPTLGLRDRNRVETLGGRAILRLTPGPWTFDFTALGQAIEGRDGQTVDADAGDLVTLAKADQPYTSRFALVAATATRRLSFGEATSATSLARQTLSELYEAPDLETGAAPRVRQAVRGWTLAQETRLSWAARGLEGLVGLSATAHTGSTERASTGTVAGLQIDRRVVEAALFADVRIPLAPALTLTLGGRVARGRVSQSAEGSPGGSGMDTAVTPDAGLVWRPNSVATLYLRHQAAVRLAGFQATAGFSPVRPDRLEVIEAGLRWRTPDDGVQSELSVARSRWTDVQADLLTEGGGLIAANVGDGVIESLKASLSWRPVPAVSLELGGFVNRNRLTTTGAGIIIVSGGEIPNVARRAASARVRVDVGRWGPGQGSLEAGLRYVGPSRLGLGPTLNRPQGDYTLTDLALRYDLGTWSVFLQADNLLDRRDSRFAFGSPYRLFEERATPMRPFSLRLGFAVDY